MTNINREEWEIVAEQLRESGPYRLQPADRPLLSRAATLIETQGRDIARVRTILALAGASGSDPMGLSSAEVVSALVDLLQSPTQAPLRTT